MYADSHPSVQPEGTYRYARNAIHESDDHVGFGLTNEQHLVEVGSFDGQVVGATYIKQRDQSLVFVKNGGASEVWLFDFQTYEKTKVVSDDEFGCNWNFSECEELYGEFKTMGDCNELRVYFSSNCTYYVLNIDALLDPDRRDCFECDDFLLFTCHCVPNLEITVSENGGVDLQAGAYQFAAQLEDEDDNKTNWFFITTPVYLDSPNFVAGERSQNAIEITINDLDDAYSKVNIAVIKTIGGERSFEKITSRHYNTSSVSITYYGTTGREEDIDLEEILVKRKTYLKGQDLAQKDGRLFLYRIKQEKNLNWQEQVTNATLKYVAYAVKADEAHKYKSFAHGETYSFAAVTPNCDGTYPPAFPFINTRAGESETKAERTDTFCAQLLTDPGDSEIDFCKTDNSFNIDGEPLSPADPDNPELLTDCPDDVQPNVAAPPPGSEGGPVDEDGDNDADNNDTDFTDDSLDAVNDAVDQIPDDVFSGEDCLDCNQEDVISASNAVGDLGIAFGDEITNNINKYKIKNRTKNKVKSPNVKNALKSLTDEINNLAEDDELEDKEIYQKTTVTVGTRQPFDISSCVDRLERGELVKVSEGNLGVYVSEEIYPETKDCDGKPIYGDYAGQPIRHFTFPDASVEPMFISAQSGVKSAKTMGVQEWDDSYVIILGLKVEGLELPEDDARAKPVCDENPVRIVMQKRDFPNQSVGPYGVFIHTFLGESGGREYAIAKHAVNSGEIVERHIQAGGDDEDHRGLPHNYPGYVFFSPDTILNKPGLAWDKVRLFAENYGRGWRHHQYAFGKKADRGIFGVQIDQRGTTQSINLNHQVLYEQAEEYDISGIAYAKGNRVTQNVAGVDLPLLGLYRESCVYMQVDRQFPALTQSGFTDHEDLSFIGDGIDHAAPITNAACWAGHLYRDIPNQYGNVESARYIDTGIVAGPDFDGSIEGWGGDVHGGFFSIKRTSYISNRVGDEQIVPSPRRTSAFLAYFGFGDCTRPPDSGDTEDVKNKANLHPGARANEATPGDGETSLYFPRTLSTLVMFWSQSIVNPWKRATGEESLGEVYYPNLKSLELDSTVPNGTLWEDAWLNRFYSEVRRQAKWQVILRVLLRILPIVWLVWFILEQVKISSIADTFLLILRIVLAVAVFAVVWFYLLKVRNINKMLDLDVCLDDRQGGQDDEAIKGWEDNFNEYNFDYSLQGELNLYIGVPDPYNVCECDDCLNDEVTNEIYYSNKQNLDSNIDAYKNFATNNYLDIPGHHGQIQRMFKIADRFYIHATDTWYNVYDEGRQIRIDPQTTSYLGTGTVLQGPKEFSGDIREGINGTRDRNAGVVLPMGYLFPDQEAKKLYLFDGSSAPKDITAFGMRSFFREYFDFCSTGCRDEKTPNGIGYIVGWDNRHNRILFTKQDGEYSWTVSYDPGRNVWISFHDYIPQFYIWNRHDLYSFKNGSFWKHHAGPCRYTNFYGVQYPFEVDFVAPSQVAYEYKSTMLDTEANLCSGGPRINLKGRRTTFDNVYLYNTTQGTGELQLVQQNREDQSELIQDEYGVTPIVRKGREWRFNKASNIADEDQPLFLRNQCDPYVYLNPAAYDVELEQDNRILQDKYLGYHYTLCCDDVQLILKQNVTVTNIPIE